MSWSFSFELLPGEEVLDDSVKRQQHVIKASYSVFLTNRRVIFRFDGMGSYLSKAFFYNDILEAGQASRLFINYLVLKTMRKEHLFNIPETGYWVGRIREAKERFGNVPAAIPEIEAASPDRKKLALLDMLTVLHKNRILTEKEFEEKVHLLDSVR